MAMEHDGRPLVWLQGEVKTPPFSASARVEAGMLLRRLQEGDRLGKPHSRPMPGIGPRCHELRVVDAGKTWRIMYRLDSDALVIADVFQKTTQQTPVRVIQDCRRRPAQYDAAAGDD
jgi:phage-related protein